MPSRLVVPNEEEIEFFIDPMPDGRIKVTCSLCAAQGRSPAAWACLNQFWASEAIKVHRGEHFMIPLDSPG